MVASDPLRVENNRIVGYFVGDVKGIPNVIRNPDYLALGDLHLTSPEPFEYQFSTKVLNLVFEAILGTN